MSKTLFVIDLVILAAAAALFGLEQALYALIVAWVTQRALNFMELGNEASQSVYIVTANPSPIQAAIVDKIKCGVTLLAVEGDAADVERTMLFTVVNRREVSRLRKAVSQIDSGAYIVVTHSSEVLGKGFRPLTHRPRKVKASDGTGARVH